MNLNLFAPIFLTKAVLKGMMKAKYGISRLRALSIKQPGSIVNVSSIVGVQGNKGQTVYSASKAGLIGIIAIIISVDANEQGSRNLPQRKSIHSAFGAIASSLALLIQI